MSKRITLVIIIIAAVAIVSAVMIMKNTGARRSSDGLSGETGRSAPETRAVAGKDSGAQGETKGASTIENAAADDKYTFIFFYADESELTQSARVAFHRIMSKITEEAVPLEVDTKDPIELPIVSKFNVRGAPMPLVLAVAPNGAITGGFPQKFEETELLGAFASPCEERSLKALQERRVVLVSIQNESTASNDAAMKGVQDFKADPDFGPSTELVTLDPADPAEARFLKALKVAPQTKDAITVCLVPPGQAVARFAGGTEKETIVAAFTSGGGCGPSGCGPSGCGN
jgi:hypothetical protein